MSSIFDRRQQHWGPLAAFVGASQLGVGLADKWSGDESRSPYEIEGINAAKAADAARKKTLAESTRAVDGSAFAPVFGGTTQTLDARSFGADATGARNIGTGIGAQQQALGGLQDARAAVANTSTAGVANAAQLQGQTAQQLQREYTGGTDPSAAQAQLQAGTDSALRAQLAAARSGGNPAAAYQAQLMGAQTLQTAANQAAVLRAQERQGARGDLLAAQGASTASQGRLVDARIGQGQALAGIAGQQAGVGASVASLGQQQQLRADGLTAQASGLREQDRQAAIGLEAAKSQEYAGARNYSLGLGAQGIQQQGVALQAGDQADRRQGVADAKTGAALQAAAGGAQQAYDSTSSADMWGGGDDAPAAGTYDPWANSDVNSKAKIKELKAENAMLKGSQSERDALAYLDTVGDTDEDIAAENAFFSRYDPQPDAAMGTYDPWGAGAPAPRYEAPPPPPPREMVADNAFAPLGSAWATSDEEAKNVHQMYDRADPIEFTYRPGYGPPGAREGITAQSLERSRLGKSMVRRDPQTGMRQVDTPQLTMANAAEISMLRDEVRSLKGGR